MRDALTWFELPANDIERARAFYEEVMHYKLKSVPKAEPIYLFPHGEEKVGGSLIQREDAKPTEDGATVYLYLEGKVSEAQARVEPAGGKVVVPEMSIPGVPGTMFVMKDTEGNRVGVHGEL